MPKNNEVNFGEYFVEPNPGLESYFDKVRSGNSVEYRTPFYKGISVGKVLEDWLPQLDQIENEWPGLYQFEHDLADKVGPLSIQKPLHERMDDIEAYYDSILLESEPIPSYCLDKVVREWGSLRGLQPRLYRKTVEKMKKSTNSGSPFFRKRKDVVQSTLPLSITRDGSTTYMIMNDGMWKAAAVLGWRGQEGGLDDNDVKQRVVWMFPFGVNIAELSVYQPAIEVAQRNNLVPAWVSMDEVDRRITNMFDSKGKHDLVICTDFTKFDQHFNANMQLGAKYIIKRLLNNTRPSQHWLEHVFPIKYDIPLAYDAGKIKLGSHGMGSGSGGTNFDETLTHRALQYECAMSKNQRLNPNSQCLGDDGVLTFPGISEEDIMRTYPTHGLDMNADKQSSSVEECTYLRRWHNINYRVDGICVGVYSTARALGRLCEQERFYDPEVWGPKMVALRQLSILENCKYHPLREQFVQFCMKGDKYRLGIDIPDFLDTLPEIVNEVNDLMPDFLGYTKSQQKDVGINSWWIVQYLKSLA